MGVVRMALSELGVTEELFRKHFPVADEKAHMRLTLLGLTVLADKFAEYDDDQSRADEATIRAAANILGFQIAKAVEDGVWPQ